MEPLTVIVVTHNRLDFTKRTLQSITRTVPHAKILIFDNDSTEAGMKDWFYSEFDGKNNVEVVLSGKNIGWGAAVNEAIAYVGVDIEDYVLISNNDVEYHDGWFEQCLALYQKYPKIGILGVWKHRAHGVRQDLGDILVKDDMPAVGWLLKKSIIDDIGPLSERGPCATKGGNGEDTNYTGRAMEKGYWVCGPKEDVAQHFDGY